ncbi:MAG TPA: glutamate-1-semialdehyde 2,1-aminomutase [Ignavibacteriaceae bacterium]|nr:glutamate-1-semialdehyde 2,1-aminomutase [Ignavibacteriaceae bacterium]
MKIEKSERIFSEAKEYIPGGVNSPVRAFKSVGGNPIFMKRGEGAYLVDVDGNKYIDYIGSWGPHIFGHNPDFIKEALHTAIEEGVSFGTPSEIEVKMARLITSMVPSVEMVRMVNSGTEATMSAVRLARGYTKKDKFIKFEGCYHGHADYFLIKAGSGALTFGVPTSPGVTPGNAKDTLIADYNSIESVKKVISENKNQIAAVIIEPAAGNMGVVTADIEFLRGLREICNEEGIILIFDEVMTGFRVAQGGVQEVIGIRADLTTFGKIIGGGLPVGAYGGRREIMEYISPSGPIYQAGTLSGNPLAMSAGFAALSKIKDDTGLYKKLEEISKNLELGIRDNLKKLGLNYCINRIGSMLCLFFTEEKVIDFKSALTSDTEKFGRYFHHMLESGIYLPPAQFEAYFISSEHSEEDISKTIEANYNALKAVH